MTRKPLGMQNLNWRRSEKSGAQNSRTWAVATPFCAAFSRPTPSGARGRYRPSGPADLFAPSPGPSSSKQPNTFES